MKTQLIILEQGNIIVSDEGFNVGEVCFDLKELELYPSKGIVPSNPFVLKVIASTNPKHNLPSINYNSLEERFAIVNVEKLAFNNCSTGTTVLSYIKGYRECESINKDKKFSLDDLKQILSDYNNNLLSQKYKGNSAEVINQYIQSLQQPKIFDVEIEMEVFTETVGTSEFDFIEQDTLRPKVTNNSIKIIKKL